MRTTSKEKASGLHHINKLWLISPASMLMAVALWQVNLGIVFFARDIFNVSPATIGLLLAISSITYGAGCLFVVPYFVHHIKPSTVLIIATLGLSISSFCMLLVQAIWYLFVLYALYGVFASLFWPTIMGWLSAGIEGLSLNRSLAIFNISFSIGNIISPYICGRLSESGTSIPLFVGGFAFLMIALGIYSFMKFVPVDSELFQCSGNSQIDSSQYESENSNIRYIAWCSLFVSFFCIGALNAVFPLAGQEELHLSKSLVGFSFLIRSLTMGITFAWLGMTSFWHFRFAPVIAGQLIGALAYLGLLQARTAYPVISCMGVIGCGVAMSYSASIYHGASGSGNKTRRMSIHESIIAISSVVGSSIGGVIYQNLSARAVYYLCAVLLVVVIGIQSTMKRLNKNTFQSQWKENT